MYLHLNPILQKKLELFDQPNTWGFKKQFVFLFLFSLFYCPVTHLSNNTLRQGSWGPWNDFFSAICEALGLFMDDKWSCFPHGSFPVRVLDPCSKEDNHYISKISGSVTAVKEINARQWKIAGVIGWLEKPSLRCGDFVLNKMKWENQLCRDVKEEECMARGGNKSSLLIRLREGNRKVRKVVEDEIWEVKVLSGSC